MNKTENKTLKMPNKITDFKKTVEIYMSELKQNPDNAQLYVDLGDVYLKEHLDIYQPINFIDEAITQYHVRLSWTLIQAASTTKLLMLFTTKETWINR
jgi:hypothetical protein